MFGVVATAMIGTMILVLAFWARGEAARPME
jgi:hypothetical protein